MKLSEIVIVRNAVRPFRKSLSRLARQGVYKTRLIGNRKDGFFVAVHRGKKAVIVSPRFEYKGQAEAWNDRKHCQPMPSRALSFAA